MNKKKLLLFPTNKDELTLLKEYYNKSSDILQQQNGNVISHVIPDQKKDGKKSVRLKKTTKSGSNSANLVQQNKQWRLSQQRNDDYIDRLHHTLKTELELSFLYKQLSSVSHKEFKGKNLHDQWEQNLEKIHDRILSLSSADLSLQYHILCHRFCNLKYDYGQALYHSRETMKAVNDKKDGGENKWKEIHYRELAYTYILQSRHKDAMTFAFKALSFSIPHSEQELKTLDVLFFILSRLNDLMGMKGVVQKAKKNAQLERLPLMSNMWKYYEGVYLFRSGKFDAALAIFSDKCGFKRTSSNWYMYSLLMEILCRIEKKCTGWLDYRYEAIKKCMARYYAAHPDNDTEFVIMVFTLLKKLKKSDYDFDLLLKKEYPLYLTILNKSSELSLYPYDPAVFDFGMWFKTNIKNKRKIS